MQPFSEQEKRQLLTEIVKHSQIDNHQLYRILGYFNVAPNWYHLALPNGKSDTNMYGSIISTHRLL
jgi:hypothetical protein